MTKNKTYHLLIFLSLVSFGFFGSLSHVFNAALILLILFHKFFSNESGPDNQNALILFIAVSGCFFLILINSLFRSDFTASLHSMSPMFPIPLIASLIVFQKKDKDFKIRAKQLSQYSQFSILFCFLLYIFLSTFFGPGSFLFQFIEGRLSLFSGNPIPFSFAVLGITIFCLADWKNSSNEAKLSEFFCFVIGSYLAGFASGTRGTLLCLLMISPIIILYLSGKLPITLVSIFIIVFVFLTLFYLNSIDYIKSGYLIDIKNGIFTILLVDEIDSSIWKRLGMWSASIKAISDGPLFGYNITERFDALKPYLDPSVPHYSHPHNDIFASIISVGFLGGIAAFLSLVSSFLASFLSQHERSEKLYLGLMLSCCALVTANVSTVFFNDICSAWLVFSTYLLWIPDFKKQKENYSKSYLLSSLRENHVSKRF